jgi:hypothetical protein
MEMATYSEYKAHIDKMELENWREMARQDWQWRLCYDTVDLADGSIIMLLVDTDTTRSAMLQTAYGLAANFGETVWSYSWSLIASWARDLEAGELTADDIYRIAHESAV